jgi:hypothetical protein
MSTWWISTLGSDANPGTGYDYNGSGAAGSEAKLTLAGVMALSGLAQGDEILYVADGDHVWTTTPPDVKTGTKGTNFTTDYGLLIRGSDEFGNPRMVTIKAVAPTGSRNLFRVVADTGWIVVRNLIYDATDLPTDSATYYCCRLTDNGTPDPGPVQFEGCALLGADPGVIHSGTRTFMGIQTGPPPGSECCNVFYCYIQNTGLLLAVGATLKKRIRGCVIYRDKPTSQSFFSQTLAASSGGEMEITNCTVYQNITGTALALPFNYTISVSLNAGVVNLNNNLVYQQSPTQPANHGFIGDGVAGDKTTVSYTGTIDYNVLIGGPDLTSGDLRTNGYYERAWDPDQNDATGSDTWPNDTIDYGIYEAELFASPTGTYAWDPLSNGATVIIVKDMRPIDHLTAGQGSSVPGALPSYVPIDADWPRVMPNIPVVETWDWLSSVVTTYEGSSEQRMSLRLQPRKRIELAMLIEDESRRREEYRRLYGVGDGQLRIPFYQYSTKLTADAAVDDLEIFFDPDKTDVRDNEIVIIYRPSTEETFAVELTTVLSDRANIALPLAQALYSSDLIIPSELAYTNNNLRLQMRSVHGNLKVDATIKGIRSSFTRPGSTATINTYDSLNVLDKLPVVRGDVPEVFDRHPVVFDNQTGIYYTETHWLHSFIDGMRSFYVNRRIDDMDYWRDFLDEARGRREPFLMPTFREDFELSAIPGQGSTTIDVYSSDYKTDYFPYDTFTRLRLEEPAGEVIYRIVDSVIELTSTTQRLTLTVALPNTSPWNDTFTIGYLNRVRLGSDQVRLNHFASYSILELNVRTTDT